MMDDRAEHEDLLNSKVLVTLSNPASTAAEAMRVLRTHLMARHVEQGHRALAVCGPTEGVGCTFVAANLAVALSQIGVNTLLMDANMRAPSLAAAFGNPSPKRDIRTALSSDVNFNDCIESGILPSLSIMFSYGAAHNAQELLAGPRFSALIGFCLREFDATVVDTPPAANYSDSRRVSTAVGYSLIVARRNKSLVNDVRHLAEQLRGDRAEVIGTVLNEM